ncbi:MAG: 3-oxoacyl-[acyl-carrier-protein] synthase III C-terminal domain-containing protein [Pseudomonadota bacterium]
MPTEFQQVYLESSGFFLPGEPVGNDGMDAYIAPVNRVSGRLKQRILAENGITQRHYAIGPNGETRWSNAQMASEAVRACLTQAGRRLADVQLLAAGSSGGDAILPGFAAMVQGELSAPPMQTHSVLGVCAAGVSALEFAGAQLELGAAERAVVVASDLPSRLFKASRFASRGADTDFDSHFLRWMLSDGAGAVLLCRQPPGATASNGALRLRLRWVHQKSFAGDYPVCMQMGLAAEAPRSYLDYASCSAAEADGALALRQNIRLLPHLFDVAIHEYVTLVQGGWVNPQQVDHFLCHYSSARFESVVDDLMTQAGLAIPKERWFSNLRWRGNTGAASIFIMLAEFLQTRTVRPGERIFCFVPESGRFTVAYLMIEVEDAQLPVALPPSTVARATPAPASEPLVEPPHAPQADDPRLARLLQSLASVWHDYRSRAWRTPLIRAIREQRFTPADYQRWMESWIPQVREGSRWMREAVASMRPPFDALAPLIEQHAGDEQFDFKILFSDYRSAGGAVDDIDRLQRNPGGEALNAYLHALAARPSPVGLLGSIYVIEGTGQRIIPALLPLLRGQLASLPPSVFRFLDYHGDNDVHHLARWLSAVVLVLERDPAGQADDAIVDTARQTAELYLLQMQHAYRGAEDRS